MNDASPTVEPEDLRRRWLSHAAAAFDLMFAAPYQEQLVTFDQREERACELGRDLAAWLLQQHANADPVAHVHEPTAPLPTCPKCGRPGRWVAGTDDEPPPDRRLATLTGEVTFQRSKARCTACRVVFFPLGPEAPSRHRGL